ncbi:hypothetical protein ACH470_00840 [Streptomyces bottropensis]|uniref:hypothetical protein n=1 Tax=Streptomyces bottropensis TaxID=42235 RepID=UPI0037A0BB7B
MLRQTEEGLYATSPQLPGFMYGRKDLNTMRAELQGAISFHLDQPGPFQIMEHHERHYGIADGELVTRLAKDEYAASRQIVYDRLGRAIRDPRQAKALAHGVSNIVGEVVYVCAVPSDTLGWLNEQLFEPADAFYAAVTVGEEMLMTLPISHGEAYRGVGETYTAGARGYHKDTRLSEIIQETRIVTPVHQHVEADAQP